MSRREHRLTIWFLISILMGLFILHGDLIWRDPLPASDQKNLLTPLNQAISLDAYSQLLKEGAIPDVQPVRDLSLWMDLKVRVWTGVGVFHFNNVLIWFFTLWGLHLLLRRVGVHPVVAGLLVLFYGFHPVFVHPVAWIAARKHLLATMFIVWATAEWIRLLQNPEEERDRQILQVFGITFLYGLSVFSHPLNLLWPAWASLAVWLYPSTPLKNETRAAFGMMAGAVGAACLGFNLRYYSSLMDRLIPDYLHYLLGFDEPATAALLAVGRSFLQLVLPLWPAIGEHAAASPLHAIGLFLLPASLLIAWRFRTGRELAVWGAYFLLPLISAGLYPGQIFASDTFVLNAGIGAWVVLGLILTQVGSRWQPLARRIATGAAVLFLGVWGWRALIEVRLWQTDEGPWRAAIAHDPSPERLAHDTQIRLETRPEAALHSVLRLRALEENGALRPLYRHLRRESDWFAEAVMGHPGWSENGRYSILQAETEETTSASEDPDRAPRRDDPNLRSFESETEPRYEEPAGASD